MNASQNSPDVLGIDESMRRKYALAVWYISTIYQCWVQLIRWLSAVENLTRKWLAVGKRRKLKAIAHLSRYNQLWYHNVIFSHNSVGNSAKMHSGCADLGSKATEATLTERRAAELENLSGHSQPPSRVRGPYPDYGKVLPLKNFEILSGLD